MSRRFQSRRTRYMIPVILSVAISPSAFAVDVRICTPQGAVDIELDERGAPQHARNFARYAESGFYSGTVIHRVVPGSMVQAGGYDQSLERRRPGAPIENEAANGQSNRRGTIAASRSEDPDSATSQFFINLADNTHLDPSADSPGYTVFGRVTGGLEVLDAISRMPTRQVGEMADVPVPLIELESVTVLDRQSLFGLSVEPDPQTLQAEFDAALARGDDAGTLDAVDRLRQSCAALTPQQHLAEAEAALSLGRVDRARYGLAQYLARATPRDPLLPRAQRLFAGLPAPAESNVEQKLAHCRRPAAPSIPDGRFSELPTMQAIESEVLRYRQLGEAYIACVSREIDSGNLNELETIDATESHNQVVIELTATANRFNQAVRAFKSAQ